MLDADKLYVITTVFNPIGYRSRNKLYEEFRIRMLNEPRVHLTTVKIEHHDRFSPIVVTTVPCRRYKEKLITLSNDSPLFHKESLLNIGIKHLPKEAKYVAWIDADVMFTNPHWVRDAIEAMKSGVDVVQVFSVMQDLDRDEYEILSASKKLAFPLGVARAVTAKLRQGWSYDCEPNLAYGLAWAATKDFLDKVGNLCDIAIIGSGDYFMAWALVQNLEVTDTFMPSLAFSTKWYEWKDKCVGTQVSNINGECLHYWHGMKRDRNYDGRTQILKNFGFDPDLHLERDGNGLFRIRDQYQDFAESMYEYFVSRKEDG